MKRKTGLKNIKKNWKNKNGGTKKNCPKYEKFGKKFIQKRWSPTKNTNESVLCYSKSKVTPKCHKIPVISTTMSSAVHCKLLNP